MLGVFSDLHLQSGEMETISYVAWTRNAGWILSDERAETIISTGSKKVIKGYNCKRVS